MYTDSNYRQLNELHTEYNDKGLEIIGFPCNQFGLQEPGKNGEEIMSGLECVRPGGAFYPFFQMAEKVDVDGVNAHPLFKRLTKKACPEEPNEDFEDNNRLFYKNLTSYDIRWNFEKFLIGRNGIPAYRFEPAFEPKHMTEIIERLLK
jgi:glutathione peroxidase